MPYFFGRGPLTWPTSVCWQNNLFKSYLCGSVTLSIMFVDRVAYSVYDNQDQSKGFFVDKLVHL